MLYKGVYIMKKEQANFRVDANAKQQAYKVLNQIGIKPTDAVNMLMHHIAMFKELPFLPRIPNTETIQTFRDTDTRKNLTHHDSIDDLFSKIDAQ